MNFMRSGLLLDNFMRETLGKVNPMQEEVWKTPPWDILLKWLILARHSIGEDMQFWFSINSNACKSWRRFEMDNVRGLTILDVVFVLDWLGFGGPCCDHLSGS